MKKTITLFMALSLVMSLMAVPVSPKLQKQGKQKTQPKEQVERVSFTRHTDLALKNAAELNIARPVAHKAVAKKNISPKAVRKATQASTFSFVSSTPAGWTVNPTPYGYETKDPARGMQMTATTTITYAGAEDVSSITVTGSTNGAGNTISVKVGTTDFGSTTLAKGDSHKAYTFSGTKSSGNVVITVTRAAKSIWIESVSFDGAGGGGDDTEISGLTQAYAIYYEDSEAYYWDFDLAAEFGEEGITYPELYFVCYDEASSKTSIVGTYAAYYAGVWKSAKDSVETDEDPVGTITVTYVEEGVYNFEGSFEGTDGNTYTWDATNVEVIAYDADNEYAEITLDEEGGGGSTVDTVAIPVNYVQAIRMDEYSEAGAYLWEFDAMNMTSDTQYESMWFYLYTPQNNRLEGIYDIESDNIYNYYGLYYYAGYTKVNGNDTTDVWAGTENIQLTVVYDENSKKYDMVGELLSEDGATLYQIEVEDMDIVAFNEEEEEIILVDSTEFVPDTIDIAGMDAIEFAYYASMSEAGSYNYSANLYNSQDNDGVPYLALDIYTAVENVFEGSYDSQNVGEYCAYYPNAESYGSSVTSPVFTISKSGDVYTIAGQFTGADQNIYRFSVSAEATMADGDHPYEPMDKQADINIEAQSKTLVTDYVADYNELDLYLNGANDTIQLALITSQTTIADGTYEISTEDEPADGELYAGYYSYYGFGGCVAYVGNDVYYLVDGYLNVATVNDTVTYTLNATSAHGTVVTAVYKEAKIGPVPGGNTIVIADYAAASFTTTDGRFTVKSAKASGSMEPSYTASASDLRLYAGNTFEISSTETITQMVFNLSKKGTERQADLTVNSGVVAYDVANAKVSWTGESSDVIFTVGAKATYGTDGNTKAGQFDFVSIEIETDGPSGWKAIQAVNQGDGKYMVNGQFFILKNNVIYNAQGQVVK